MPQAGPGAQVVQIALPWFEAGCNVIPIKPDGSKKPTVKWKPYINQRVTKIDLDTWFRSGVRGVAVICGAVSGGLEMLELEGRVTDSAGLSRVEKACIDAGVVDLWEFLCHDGYSEWTPSGGLHLLYRLSNHEPGDVDVPGNTKLALRFATTEELKDNPKDLYRTLAETRGEGGYVIVAPTPGVCHPSGEPWTTLAGTPATIPTITWEQRCALHAAITTGLDEIPAPVPTAYRSRGTVQLRDGLSPGDDYAQRTDWAELLEPEGWTLESQRGEERMWTRPGKSTRDGISATTDYQGKPGLYVFSSSTGLPTETPLSKLFVYAFYRHGGDMSRAARDLASQGFGQRNQQTGWGTLTSSIPATVSTASSNSAVVVTVPPNPPDLSFYTHSDSGNGERMVAMFGDQFRYIPVRNKWMHWDGTMWCTDYRAVYLTRCVKAMVKVMHDQGVNSANDALVKHANKSLSAERIGATVKMLASEKKMFAEADDFDRHRHLLNVENGILNLTTGDLIPHDPSYLCTKKMNASYQPDAPCPRWDEYLSTVIPDPELRDFTQRMAGYTMTGNPVQRALAILYGPGGTGKSRFVEILAALFGSYGATAAESLFRSKREQNGPTNDLNDLRGARLASVSELDYGIRMDEALVKRLTGLDRITSRGLYEENQTWLPQCVIWLATNHLPRINSDDGAIWDRMKVIAFKEQITEEKKDPYILDKLMAEADGILNWLLAGVAKYQELGLDQPERVRQSVAEYQNEQDVVRQFLEDSETEGRLLINADNHEYTILRTQLYAMFHEWCRANLIPSTLGQMRFNARLAAHGYGTVKRSRWYWVGIQVGDQGALGMMG
jgi:putative DNA primase/helicase